MVIRADQPAPHVLRLLINRPEKRNAIDHNVRQALIDALTAAHGDAGCRAVVLGGVDGVFSAGGDVPSMADLSEAQACERLQHIHALCQLVAGLRVPVVSAAEGFCAGAAIGLALLGDHVVVSAATKILFPFMKLGLVPDWGMLRTLPARVGLAAARRLLISGRIILSEEALRMNLVDECAQDQNTMTAAIERAVTLSQLPQEAFARMKVRLNQPSASFEDELAREQKDQVELLLGADFREGFAAFSEKRDPDFIAAARRART